MLPDRFWEKVDTSGGVDACWPWLACRVGGYGHFRWAQKGKNAQKAHRLAYEDAYGPIPPGKIVMHSCDNPSCVNPKHLAIGTLKENNADRDRKGRHIAQRGHAHGMSKISHDGLQEIIALRNYVNQRVTEISKWHGVPKTTVRDVLRGKTWAWFK